MSPDLRSHCSQSRDTPKFPPQPGRPATSRFRRPRHETSPEQTASPVEETGRMTTGQPEWVQLHQGLDESADGNVGVG